jgi:hypothetical protein
MTTHSVDPARLRWGTWCHRTEKILGEGDIAASYSADRIGMGEPLRRPFDWKGSLWVCVSRSDAKAEAYRLTHPQAFNGVPLTYRTKITDGDAARKDPNGFYHGMSVSHNGRTFVLCGPHAVLVAGEPQQMDLFAGLL